MKFEQVIKHFGSQVAVAKALKIRQPTVSMWRARGRVPELQQLKIEKLTNMKLRADPSILGRKVSHKL